MMRNLPKFFWGAIAQFFFAADVPPPYFKHEKSGLADAPPSLANRTLPKYEKRHFAFVANTTTAPCVSFGNWSRIAAIQRQTELELNAAFNIKLPDDAMQGASVEGLRETVRPKGLPTSAKVVNKFLCRLT